MARLHFTKLSIRGLLFIAALTAYLIDKTLLQDNIYKIGANSGAYLLIIIWVVFIVEMVFRFFPSKYESMGCQKQFSRNFIQNNSFLEVTDAIRNKHNRSVVIVAISWIILNGIIAALFFTGIISAAILIIISLFYAVCDIICILFYCPFQSLMMKNRCCVTCRIYNWDFLMMFTPMVFIISLYTLSLFAIGLLLFIKWEVDYYRHPERFCNETNERLNCDACTEKLCVYKKSLFH